MNRRGFFTRIGSLIAGAFAVNYVPVPVDFSTSTHPFWQSQLSRPEAYKPLTEALLFNGNVIVTHKNHAYVFDNIVAAEDFAQVGDIIDISVDQFDAS